MNTSKVAVTVSAFLGKMASITGYFLTFLFLGTSAVLMHEVVQDGSMEATAGLIVVLVLLFFSVLLIVSGAKAKRRIKRFRRYVSLISGHNMTSIDELASSTSRPAAFVKKDLRKMIARRFFTNAAIDEAANEIIIGGGAAAGSGVQSQSAAPRESETFCCRGCGASGVKPKGLPGTCDYCGSAI